MSKTFLGKRTAAVAALAAGALVALSACASPAATTPTESAADGTLQTLTEGKLTIATGEPAFYPWVIDDAPESGEGFESAVAYAVAEELGFAKEDVVWVRTTFDSAIAPGPKDFDFNIQQYTISDERKQAVDFSTPYYTTNQAVLAVEGSPAADATSLAELKDTTIGVAAGTTSLGVTEDVIAPSTDVQVFNSNEDAVLALSSGQIDAVVTDLPTAFYLAGVELDNGVLVGQLEGNEGGDEFGLLLAKDSPLTAPVSEAVQALIDSGKLEEITTEWLSDAVDVPVLK